MYRNDEEAARARLQAVESELAAEQKRRQAVESDAEAARAERDAAQERVRELEGQLARHGVRARQPARGVAARKLALAGAVLAVVLALIAAGVMFFWVQVEPKREQPREVSVPARPATTESTGPLRPERRPRPRRRGRRRGRGRW